MDFINTVYIDLRETNLYVDDTRRQCNFQHSVAKMTHNTWVFGLVVKKIFISLLENKPNLCYDNLSSMDGADIKKQKSTTHQVVLLEISLINCSMFDDY